MSKFGELIETRVPVLLDFYAVWDDACKGMHPVLRDVAAALGDKARVIKIDVEKKSLFSSKGLKESILTESFSILSCEQASID